MRCPYPRDIFIKSIPGSIQVPCGKCFACRSRKKSQSVFRIDAHRRFSQSKNCFFVTLTYADEFVPYSYQKVDYRTGELLEEINSDTPILNPNDIVRFFKRFRRYSDAKVKYFYVGEYGDKFDRPHWHIILHTDLNWYETKEAIKHAWSVSTYTGDLRPGSFIVCGDYTTFRRSIGRISVSSVTMRRIRYCAKYVVKDNNSSALVPKFARWSKKYGIDWLKSSEAKATVDNERIFAFTLDGKPASLSRYYTHRLYQLEQWNSLVDKLICSQLPPDGVFGEKYKVWHRENERKNISQINAKRIQTFTPLIPL